MSVQGLFDAHGFDEMLFAEGLLPAPPPVPSESRFDAFLFDQYLFNDGTVGQESVVGQAAALFDQHMFDEVLFNEFPEDGERAAHSVSGVEVMV